MNDDLGRSDPASARLEARARAVRSDAAEGAPFQLAELWSRVRAGEWRLRDAFSDPGRWYALVETTPYRGESERRRGSGLSMFEQVLLGQTSKVVAIERNLSPSAVAYAMRSVLDSIGLGCRLRGVPQILMLSARLAQEPPREVVAARIARVAASHDTWVVSTRCPKLDLLNALSRAERAVMLQLLDGCDYKQIARTRKTSLRTVANQVTMSFRKLGVSGRAELVDRLLERSLGTTVVKKPRLRPMRSAQVAVAASSVG